MMRRDGEDELSGGASSRSGDARCTYSAVLWQGGISRSSSLLFTAFCLAGGEVTAEERESSTARKSMWHGYEKPEKGTTQSAAALLEQWSERARISRPDGS